MNWFLTIVIVVLAVLVVVSLVRGIVAFLQTTKIDLNNQENADYVAEMHAKQNKAMFARVKYQALAIVVVFVLLAINN
jgi:NADH:ubiquinone oxidoreductase subunit 3 (subunit A)